MKERRKAVALKSLSKVPPSSKEAADLHSFYLKHGEGEDAIAGADHVFMADTIVEKCMLMFPQERKCVPGPRSWLANPRTDMGGSVHQKIFGGYLMRLAYEVRLKTICSTVRWLMSMTMSIT